MNPESQQSEYLKYWTLLRRKWIPASLVALAVFSFNTVRVLNKPDIYRASGQLVYKPQEETQDLIGLENSLRKVSANESTIAREIAVLQSKPVLKQVLDSISPVPPEFKLESRLKRNLSIRIEPKTTLVRISFDSENPDFSQVVVNQLMELFLERNISQNRASSIAAGNFISNQLPEVRRKVLIASTALQRFQEKHQLISLDSDWEGASGLLSQGRSNLAAIEAQIAGAEQQLADLRKKLNLASSNDSLRVTDTSQSLENRQAIESFRAITAELRSAEASLTQNHPQILELQGKQLESRQKMARLGIRVADLELEGTGPELGETRQTLANQLIQIELEQKSLIEQRLGLLRQQQNLSARVSDLPQLQNQYRELQRELQAAELTYDSLLQRLQEIKVTENQTIPNVEIIEPALAPNIPILPNRTSEIMRGAIAALLLSYVTAYLLNQFDRRVRSVDDVQSLYPFPLLGTIPSLAVNFSTDMAAQLPLRDSRKSSVSESYRMLQANLKFLQSDQPLQSITISSAISGEGKSTTAANLALALAESHRVLLIDADLRRPTQHQIWECNNQYGLSNILTDLDRSFSSVRQNLCAGSENLTVFPAGVIPPNPVTLLESQRMKQFLEWCRDEFKYIIIDLPPINVAADALFVSNIADGLLLVGRPDHLNRTAAKHCVDSIKQAQINLLGIIVNGMIIKNEANSYYYYQSQYKDKYYEENNKEDKTDFLNIDRRLSRWIKK